MQALRPAMILLLRQPFLICHRFHRRTLRQDRLPDAIVCFDLLSRFHFRQFISLPKPHIRRFRQLSGAQEIRIQHKNALIAHKVAVIVLTKPPCLNIFPHSPCERSSALWILLPVAHTSIMCDTQLNIILKRPFSQAVLPLSDGSSAPIPAP